MLVKNRAFNAVLWSGFQRFGALAISFVSNMVLARLLSPEDFGCMGLILIFVSFADVLVDGGLGSALIFKKNPKQEDYSTVFTANLIISLLLFLVIFVCAPLVAEHVKVPKLTLYLRVESVTILIRAFYAIHFAVFNKNLKFRQLAIINLLAASISAVVSILMAANGCGIWSLIAKNVLLHLCTFIFFMLKAQTTYHLGFNIGSFKELFGFGWSVALTAFLDLCYSNLVSFVIGKRYSIKDLGYYNQAHSLQQIPVYSLSMMINQVLFPFLSKVQDDISKVRYNAQRVISITTFVMFPILIYFIFFGKQTIILLYSAKWTPSTIFFQILLIGGLVNSLIHINRNILKSIGETSILFKTQVVITILGISLVLLLMRYDIKVIVSCVALCSYINWILVGIVTGRKIGYSFPRQISDILVSFLFAGIAGIISYYICCFLIVMPIFFTLLSSSIIFLFIYLVFHLMFRTKAMAFTLQMVFPDKFSAHDNHH